MPKLTDLNFRSGFFLDSAADAGAYLVDVGKLEPAYAVMRVAIAGQPRAITQSKEVEAEVEVKPKEKSLLNRMFGFLSADSSVPETVIETETVQPKLSQDPDITKTNAGYAVVDFKVPIKRDEDGLLVLDRERLTTVEKIKDDEDFNKALFNVMTFANPNLTNAYNQRNLPRLPEGDEAFLSMLTAADFKTAKDESLIDFARMRTVEDFLNDHKVGFNALDPFIRNRVDLDNLSTSTSVITLPNDYCRAPAEAQDQYEFKRVTTPLTVIQPSFAVAASPVHEMSDRQKYALACLKLMESAKFYFEGQGFKFDFSVDKFDSENMIFTVQMEGPLATIEQTIKCGPQRRTSDPSGRNAYFVTDIEVINFASSIKEDTLCDLYHYRENMDHYLFESIKQVYDDSIFAERMRMVSSNQDSTFKLAKGPN